MSLVNPLNHWWNRKPVRRALGWACWVLAAVAVAAASAGVALELDFSTGLTAPTWVIPVGMVVGMLGMLGGIFLHIAGRDGEDMDFRIISHPIGAMFLIMGAVPTGYSLAAGQPVDLTFLIFAIAAVVALVLAEILIRRSDANNRIRAAVRRDGVRALGTVMRATVYQQDYSTVTRVTVRFTDQQGDERWTAGTLGGKVGVGGRVHVRYLPSALGRRAGVVIEPR